jgi:hypothetical protein
MTHFHQGKRNITIKGLNHDVGYLGPQVCSAPPRSLVRQYLGNNCVKRLPRKFAAQEQEEEEEDK